MTLNEDYIISISNLDMAKFTPTATKLAQVLNTGIWVVGWDISLGRYVATPSHGDSGNFVVWGFDGTLKTNEILDSDTTASFGISMVTVDLEKWDTISIGGIKQVRFTAPR